MKLYIAGPMTGLPEYNFPVFAEAARNLRLAGFEVFPAHEIDHGEDPANIGHLTHEQYLKADLRVLLQCDAAAFLPGWTCSRGATVEMAVCVATGVLRFEYQTTGDDNWTLNQL